MTNLWPRISRPVARAAFEELGTVSVTALRDRSSTSHPNMSYAATGGSRVTASQIEAVAQSVRDTARSFGYPQPSSDADRVGFDRAAASVVFPATHLTTFEAANPGMWSFLAVVAMPDVTSWRFGRRNLERWVASDLTRHMFARLWWQVFSLGRVTDGILDLSLLNQLSESDLNQIMERRSVAGNPRLAMALARAVVRAQGPRREIVRALTPALRRRLAFIDFAALSEDQIDAQIAALSGK